MAQVMLVVLSGRLKGQCFSLEEGAVVTLGRSIRSDINIPDKGISRLHCRLEHRSDGVHLIDLGSSNGTLVNGVAVHEQLLQLGDTLSLGASTLCLQAAASSATEGAEAPEPSHTPVSLVRDFRPGTTTFRKKFDRHTTALAVDEEDNPKLALARKRLAAICEMTNTICTQLDLDVIYNAAVETILEITDADRSAILIIDEVTNEPEPVATQTIRPDFPKKEFRVSRTIVEETLRQGVSIISSDAALDERFKVGASIVAQNIHSVMCVPLRTDEKIIGALYVDSQSLACTFSERELALLATIGQQAGVGIERARLISDLENLFVGAMHSIITSLEAKDAYTRGHSERVTAFGLLIADELKLPQVERDALELGALLHDVGKIGIREAVLLKPDKLTREEYEEIKKHPEIGRHIIENMPEIGRIVSMNNVVDIVTYHHEAFDGNGYPQGLGGDDIPFHSRIIAVADTFDAITSDRPYRKGRDDNAALATIRECSGRQFDPEVVRAFEKVFARGETQHPEAVLGRFQSVRIMMRRNASREELETAN